jgi:hypothetical protein
LIRDGEGASVTYTHITERSTMSTSVLAPQLQHTPIRGSVRQDIAERIDTLMASLPRVENLDSAHRRDMMARYTAVLEGNFIYWTI